MKRLFMIMCMALCMTQGHAQNHHKRLQAAFDEFRRQAHEDFDDFRRQCMEQYLSFVTDPWKEFKSEEPVPMPKDDEVPPVVMPKDDKDKQQKDKPVVIEEVVEPVIDEPQPEPVAPIEEVPVVEEKYVDFTFFGTNGRVRFDRNNQVHLTSLSEQSIADALRQMSQKEHDNMILDCLTMRDELHLSDWGYLQMLKHLSETIAGKDTNDATVLLAYLFMQSGYKTRMGMINGKLYALYASRYEIYGQNAYKVDGVKFYGLEDLPSRLNICQAAYPKERELSLDITKEQMFTVNASDNRTLSSKMHPDVKCNVRTNKNAIDFYATYPTSMYGGNFMTRWAMYANTPLSGTVKELLYPVLRKYNTGKSQVEATSILLDFVQWAFVYEYDDKVWGQDRAFFAEETLFYPYADCEDRSILFSRLVRDLVGLKVALVYYPGHLATAVHFSDTVAGDYLQLGDKRFVICDPTYFGAPVGRTMPEMNNKTAKAIILD